jgi:uncharacterized protein YodC (DUF2158 family)
MSFNVGDVVVLKSGGPKMTVDKISGNEVQCVWFEGANQKYGAFPPNALKAYEPIQGQSSQSGGGPEGWMR